MRTADRDPHLASIVPHAIHEFQIPRIEWLIQRQMFLHRIDVIQLEYTALGQYARRFERLVCALFEHDVYFQSIGRALPFIRSPLERMKARFEYLRAIRFELKMLPKCDHIQVCTLENRRYLESFLPRLSPRIDAGMRAGIDTGIYPFPGGPREPYTMLFLGSFRHTPNQVALDWFARFVLPLIVAKIPQARLLVAGSDPPPRHAFSDPANAIDLLGFVEDIQPLFSSTARCLCARSAADPACGSSCWKRSPAEFRWFRQRSAQKGWRGWMANSALWRTMPRDFAEKAIQLLEDSELAAEMARRARAEVVENWDMAVITRRLVAKYREIVDRRKHIILSDDQSAEMGRSCRVARSTGAGTHVQGFEFPHDSGVVRGVIAGDFRRVCVQGPGADSFGRDRCAVGCGRRLCGD